MKISVYGRRVVSLFAATALLAGCGFRGAVPAEPSGATDGAAAPEASWIAPDAGSKNLLYVSDAGTDKVNIYSYPGGKLEGVLSGFQRPAAMCANKEGDVFIPDLQGFSIYEYRHGAKKPVAVLHDPGEEPDDCSVDPTTGNLAVANLSTPYTGPGDVLVYFHAHGKPQKIKDPQIVYYLFCAYDDHGNLFQDGMTTGQFKFAELPKASTAFVNIMLDKTFRFGGAVQWDGSDVAVGDYESSVIYRFKIDGNNGTTVGQTHLRGSDFAIGLWIQGSTVIGPNDDSTTVMFWKYPAGGVHVKQIRGLQNPWGAVVSLAK